MAAGPGSASPTGRGGADDVVELLLADLRFAEVGAVAGVLGLDPDVRRRVRALCAAGERVLCLDAEDFGELDVPSALRTTLRAAQFPARAEAAERGSLDSLVPLYALMLEVLDVRWRRREMLHVVVLLHLFAEYLPLLAWQRVLGHAGDPVRLEAAVSLDGSRWGTGQRRCDHTPGLVRAARRALTVRGAGDEDWASYLNKTHSRLATALGVCALHPVPGRPHLSASYCRSPCAVFTSLDPQVADDLGARVHLAHVYMESEVVDLRHYSPVGHFFGVPGRHEVDQAWVATWHRLARPWRSGTNPLAEVVRSGLHVPDEALPGLAATFTAVAGEPVCPSDALHQLRDAVAGLLRHGR